MSPIKVTWKGEFVGVVAPSGTYATSSSVRYADGSRYNGSLALIVTELRIPDSASLQKVYALDILFNREWYMQQAGISGAHMKWMPDPEPTPEFVACDERLVKMLKTNVSSIMTGSGITSEVDFWLSEAELEDEFKFSHVAFPAQELHIVFIHRASKNLMAVVLKN